MKTGLTSVIIFVIMSWLSFAESAGINFDLFLKSPKYIGITHHRNFENGYNYIEIKAGAGDLTLENHYDNVYTETNSKYFQPGLGLKFEDSGEISPYFCAVAADVEKISNKFIWQNGLKRIGITALSYSRTLDFYEETKWLSFKTGMGYLFYNQYPSSLRLMLNADVGYSTIKLDTAFNKDFIQYASSQFKNLDMKIELSAKYDFAPLVIDFRANARTTLDKRSFTTALWGAEFSYIDRLTANVMDGNAYSLIDFTNFKFFLNCFYESIFVEDSGYKRWNYAAGFYYYFNNREPAESYKEANP